LKIDSFPGVFDQQFPKPPQAPWRVGCLVIRTRMAETPVKMPFRAGQYQKKPAKWLVFHSGEV